MRIIQFTDGAQSETTPTIGNIIASNLIQYPDDATYEANEQGAPQTGNLYYNTTSNVIRYYNSTIWQDIIDETTPQFLENKDVDGSSTGNNTVKTVSTNVEVIPAGNISSINVGAALNELDNEKQAVNEKGNANGYASLDALGKVPSSQIPPIALTTVSVVADITARDLLTVEEGDVAQTLDTGNWYIYDGTTWQPFSAPAGVNSVNGQTGTVSLDIDDLTDVDTSTVPPVADDVLTWDGAKWAPKSTGDAYEDVSSVGSTSTLTVNQETVLVGGPSAYTITLPSAVGIQGKKYKLKKAVNNFFAVTIQPDGAETIDFVSNTSINTYLESLVIISDGVGWQIVERYIPSITFPYTPTGTWATNVTYTGRWWRIGNRIYIDAQAVVSASGSTGNFTLNIPSGLTMIAADIISQNNMGTSTVNDTGSGSYIGVVVYNNTTSVSTRYTKNFSGAQFLVTATHSDPFGTLASGDYITVKFDAPITGWKG